MTQMWQLSMNLMGWMTGQDQELEQEHDQCDCMDDNDIDLQQESSGIGTVIVIYTALTGLFIGANLIPSQMTQATRSVQERQRVRERELQRRKSQQRRTSNRLQRKLTADKWQEVVAPTPEEEAEWLHGRAMEMYYDVLSEEDGFMDARDN